MRPTNSGKPASRPLVGRVVSVRDRLISIREPRLVKVVAEVFREKLKETKEEKMPKDSMEYKVSKPVTKVVLIDALIRCTLCGGYKPASEVGFRRTKDGVLRNQPQCKACRAG